MTVVFQRFAGVKKKVAEGVSDKKESPERTGGKKGVEVVRK